MEAREQDCMNITIGILKDGIPYWQLNEYFSSLPGTVLSTLCVDSLL